MSDCAPQNVRVTNICRGLELFFVRQIVFGCSPYFFSFWWFHFLFHRHCD